LLNFNSWVKHGNFLNQCYHYRGNTALKATVPAVLPQPLSPLPQQWFPLPRYICGYHGITVVPITIQVSTAIQHTLLENAPILVLILDRDRSEWIGSVPVQWKYWHRSDADSPFRPIVCFI